MFRQTKEQETTLNSNFLNLTTNPDLTIDDCTAALNFMRELVLNPTSKFSIHLAIGNCDKIIKYSLKALDEEISYSLDLLNLAYFTKGILLAAQKDSRAAISVLAKIGENIDSEKLLVEFFSSNMQSMNDNKFIYQDLVDGLYFALWLKLRLDKKTLCKLSAYYAAAGDSYKAKITREMLFNQVRDFAELNLLDNELDVFIKNYLDWFKENRLNSIDNAAKLSAWRPLELMFIKNLSALPLLFMPLVNEYKGELYTLIIDKAKKWLDKLANVLIAQKRNIKTVEISGIESLNVASLFARIEANRATIDKKEKHCPNVLPYMRAIIDLLGASNAVFSLRIRLADIYLQLGDFELTKEQYNVILLNDEFNSEALLKMSKLAFLKNKIEEATIWCNKALTINPSALSFLDIINSKKSEFTEKLNKISKHRQNVEKSSVKDIQKEITECDIWLNNINEEADIYPYIMLERAILKLHIVLKNNKLFRKGESKDVYLINADDYREINGELTKVKSRIPNSYLTLMSLGKVNKLAGKLIQARFESIYMNLAKTTEEEYTILRNSADETYRGALEHYIGALELDFTSIEARWEMVLLQEYLKQYSLAKENCIIIYNTASDNQMVQRARLKLAELNARLEDYPTAYSQFKSIVDELIIPDSPFNLANSKQEIASKIKLYYATAQISVNYGSKNEGITLLNQVRELALSAYSNDFHGFKLLYLSESSKMGIDTYVALLKEPYNKTPILVKCGAEHKLYISINGHYSTVPIELGNINVILSNYGICVPPGSSMMLQGDYSDLFRYIREKSNYCYIEAWDKTVLDLIDNSFRNALAFIEQQSAEIMNRYRFHTTPKSQAPETLGSENIAASAK